MMDAAVQADTLEARRNREIDVLARTLYGEARGESIRGKEAVACVILNRVKRAKDRGGYWWGADVIGVCQKPWQFSCWNVNDPNREKLLAVEPGNRVFDTCVRIAKRALSGCIDDPTGGATHYHTRHVNPPWAVGRPASFEIGRHLFYNSIE
ncbi:MAG: cell wall hydrolase [Alphaproteobacteria bacterium]|nr:cell wall hydrolase [Alphaproteobacteria bacterium]MBF0251252.1 cell wall hydrolase [Alphaproteobacteria bacterium]